jgi:DNA-binding transcriptional ArsR family regulator
LNEITGEGFSPSLLLCPECEHLPECTYYQERNSLKPGIYFVTHHMLQYLKDKIPNPDLIILDENLIGGFLLEDNCTDRQMKSLDRLINTPADIRLLDKILDIADGLSTEVIKAGSHPRILNARKMTTDDYPEDHLLGVLAKQNEVPEDEIFSRMEQLISNLSGLSEEKLFKQGINLKALNWLRGLVHSRLFSYLLISDKGDVYFKTKYVAPMPYRATPIKILDATGNRLVVNALFHRNFQEMKLDVKWPAKTVHLKRSTSRGIMEAISDKHLIELLRKALNQVQAQNILLVTYKFLKTRVKKICESLEPGKNFQIHHFQGPRGINTFENCEAVIVIGTPRPNINSTWQDAHILFPGKENSEIRDFWNYANTMWETLQVIHRIRPVLKTHTELVMISSYWPHVLPEPETVIDLSHDMNWKTLAIQHLDPYVKEFGFLNQDLAFLVGVSIKQKENVARVLKEGLLKIRPVVMLLKSYSFQPVEMRRNKSYFLSESLPSRKDFSLFLLISIPTQVTFSILFLLYITYIIRI